MDKYRQSPPTIANTLVGWIVNLSMQTILQMFHPIYSPHQQYSPPLRTVKRWAKWFREGREEVDDEARPADQLLKQRLKILNKSVILSMMILIAQLKNCRNKLV
ncbi:unnamed protein product [Rotaria magnacalcarata]|uniref:Uncharacterized protein n=1 Tax=Rotaria magnacalcarata TaxID=392030 RepID=A0A8S2NZI4_9BILA|nr:unnamed protein product [Rotaria magnacalcarata]